MFPLFCHLNFSGVWGKLIHDKTRSSKSRNTVSLSILFGIFLLVITVTYKVDSHLNYLTSLIYDYYNSLMHKKTLILPCMTHILFSQCHTLQMLLLFSFIKKRKIHVDAEDIKIDLIKKCKKCFFLTIAKNINQDLRTFGGGEGTCKHNKLKMTLQKYL
jgi:hypothetical protein